MTLRTKDEQKAYLDGFETCGECIEKYLSDKGKKVLESLLVSVRKAVEIKDIEENKKGVLESIAKEQKTLLDTTKAWSKALERGDIY